MAIVTIVTEIGGASATCDIERTGSGRLGGRVRAETGLRRRLRWGGLVIGALGGLVLGIAHADADGPRGIDPRAVEVGQSAALDAGAGEERMLPPEDPSRPGNPRIMRRSVPEAERSLSANALYFFFMPEGCAHCRSMARVVERLHQDSLRGGENRIDVYGVAIGGSPSEVQRFRRATGFTAPLAEDPRLRPISMHEHPVAILYNTTTRVHRIASVGVVPYASLEAARLAFTTGKRVRPEKGPA